MIVILGVWIISTLTEAHFLFTAMFPSMQIPFSDVLFAPMDERYAVSVLFGFSFATSATLVAAYVALIRIPATITVRQRKSKPLSDS